MYAFLFQSRILSHWNSWKCRHVSNTTCIPTSIVCVIAKRWLARKCTTQQVSKVVTSSRLLSIIHNSTPTPCHADYQFTRHTKYQFSTNKTYKIHNKKKKKSWWSEDNRMLLIMLKTSGKKNILNKNSHFWRHGTSF